MKLNTVDKMLVTSCREISIATEDFENAGQNNGAVACCCEAAGGTGLSVKACLDPCKHKPKI